MLGSNAPPLTVKLLGAFSSGSKDAFVVESQELKFDAGTGVNILNNLPKSIDVGSYTFIFEADMTSSSLLVMLLRQVLLLLLENFHMSPQICWNSIYIYIYIYIYVFCFLQENFLLRHIELDLPEPPEKAARPPPQLVDPYSRYGTKADIISLTLELGLKLYVHLAVHYVRKLNFHGLVEKFFYLSGRYDIELTVGDAAMENFLLRAIGHIELDLPEPPEKAGRPPPQLIDPYSRYGPKAEITHIFWAP